MVNVTTPVGSPTPGAGTLTVAVKATGWPNSAGFTLLASAVVVFALFTTWKPASWPSLPRYAALVITAVALIVEEPTGSVPVISTALPPASAWGLPNGAPPAKNWTLPPTAAGSTVAVKTTPCPKTLGLDQPPPWWSFACWSNTAQSENAVTLRPRHSPVSNRLRTQSHALPAVRRQAQGSATPSYGRVKVTL